MKSKAIPAVTTSTPTAAEKSDHDRPHLQLLARALAWLARLLGEQVGVDVWQNTTLGDGDVTEKLVEFFVVADGQL